DERNAIRRGGLGGVMQSPRAILRETLVGASVSTGVALLLCGACLPPLNPHPIILLAIAVLGFVVGGTVGCIAALVRQPTPPAPLRQEIEDAARSLFIPRRPSEGRSDDAIGPADEGIRPADEGIHPSSDGWPQQRR